MEESNELYGLSSKEFHDMLHHNEIDSIMNGNVILTRIEP